MSTLGPDKVEQLEQLRVKLATIKGKLQQNAYTPEGTTPNQKMTEKIENMHSRIEYLFKNFLNEDLEEWQDEHLQSALSQVQTYLSESFQELQTTMKELGTADGFKINELHRDLAALGPPPPLRPTTQLPPPPPKVAIRDEARKFLENNTPRAVYIPRDITNFNKPKKRKNLDLNFKEGAENERTLFLLPDNTKDAAKNRKLVVKVPGQPLRGGKGGIANGKYIGATKIVDLFSDGTYKYDCNFVGVPTKASSGKLKKQDIDDAFCKIYSEIASGNFKNIGVPMWDGKPAFFGGGKASRIKDEELKEHITKRFEELQKFCNREIGFKDLPEPFQNAMIKRVVNRIDNGLLLRPDIPEPSIPSHISVTEKSVSITKNTINTIIHKLEDIAISENLEEIKDDKIRDGLIEAIKTATFDLNGSPLHDHKKEDALKTLNTRILEIEAENKNNTYKNNFKTLRNELASVGITVPPPALPKTPPPPKLALLNTLKNFDNISKLYHKSTERKGILTFNFDHTQETDLRGRQVKNLQTAVDRAVRLINEGKHNIDDIIHDLRADIKAVKNTIHESTLKKGTSRLVTVINKLEAATGGPLQLGPGEKLEHRISVPGEKLEKLRPLRY